MSLEINHHLVAFLLKLSKSVDVHRSYDVPDPCHFYRAVLCIHCTSHGPVSNPSVRPSVRPSQVGVLLKQLNVGSHMQHHTIV